MIDTDLSEDLYLKEDQSRLTRCKDFFSELSSDSTTSLPSDIINYLHDKWSVIRSDCGKRMKTIVYDLRYSDYLFGTLFPQLLLSCKNSNHWQEIHGSLLGLNALVLGTDDEMTNSVSTLCLDLIGHVSIPVKEASRNCLITTQKKVSNKHRLVHQIVDLANSITAQAHNDSETTTLTLDGLLGCLVDNYQQFPVLLHPSRISSGNGDDNQKSSMDTVQTIRRCALHPASTVRQKAGQILTMFVMIFLKKSSENNITSGEKHNPAKVPEIVQMITSMWTTSIVIALSIVALHMGSTGVCRR